MKFLFFVLLPTCIQLLVGSLIMFSPRPGGEFVGLGVMLLGMFAVPITAAMNWARMRAKPPMPMIQLINRTFYTTLVFPALCMALYLLAS